MPTVVLFDIDGTMVKTAGAGRAALDAAVADVTGVRGALADVPIAGRTDRAILTDALNNAGVAASEQNAVFQRVAEIYLRLLPGQVAATGGTALPGVAELLAALTAASAICTIATGNLRGGAEVKLRHFDLWRPGFELGGFGDVSPIRADIVRAAMRPHIDGATSEFVVIGDTPHDISAASEAGARVIAVATGNFSSAALTEAGAGTVFETLAETSAVLRAILGS
ncbi:MAG: HAD family hydrolase [Tepidiformaceae bacterium]